MLDANPSLTPAQVKSIITGTAIDWARGGDNKTAGTTGQDIDYGFGRLDGYAAIEAAKGSDIGTPPDAPVHVLREGTLGGTGQFIDYTFDVTSTAFPIAATLIMSVTSSRVVVRVTGDAELQGVRVVVQVQAVCAAAR